MKPEIKHLFAELTKTEEQSDGTIKVMGYASSEAKDAQGEVIKADAIAAAIPDFMKYGTGNLREMHKTDAAGTVPFLKVLDDGRTEIHAHVVDPVAVQKVKTGVYKGFSIGGSVTQRDSLDKSVIKGVKLSEISLVDRPANPEAVITFFKLEDGKPDGATSAAMAKSAEEQAVDELADLLDKGEISASQLVALAKAAPAAAAEKSEPVLKMSAVADSLKKFEGEEAWDAATAIDCISRLFRLLSCEQDEAENASEQVAAIRAAIQSLKDFVVSEIQEDNAKKGEATGNLAKAGAKFSTDTKDALKGIHDSLKDCCDRMDKIGYAADETDKADKADKATSLAKRLHDASHAGHEARLAKAVEDMAKGMADLRKTVAAKDERIDELAKAIGNMPTTPKGGQLFVMGHGGQVEDQLIVKHADGTTDQNATAALQIRKAREAVGMHV